MKIEYKCRNNCIFFRIHSENLVWTGQFNFHLLTSSIIVYIKLLCLIPYDKIYLNRWDHSHRPKFYNILKQTIEIVYSDILASDISILAASTYVYTHRHARCASQSVFRAMRNLKKKCTKVKPNHQKWLNNETL